MALTQGRKSNPEGRMAWDLLPDSKMTNGAVNLQVEGVQGGLMTVTYKGQESKIVLMPEKRTNPQLAW